MALETGTILVESLTGGQHFLTTYLIRTRAMQRFFVGYKAIKSRLSEQVKFTPEVSMESQTWMSPRM
jgi:hypothetical protein